MKIDDTPEGHHVTVDLHSPTDDRLRVAWYGEVGDEAPVRIFVEDGEGHEAIASLSPSEGVLVARALLVAARQSREVMPEPVGSGG